MSRAAQIAQLSRTVLDGRVACVMDEDIARADAAGCFVHNPWKGRHPRYQPTRYQPTVNWSQGGAIVELLVRLGMEVCYGNTTKGGEVACSVKGATFVADTLLEAAMRCLVLISDVNVEDF